MEELNSNLKSAGHFVDQTIKVLGDGDFSLKKFPSMLKSIIKKGFWKERYIKSLDKNHKCNSFEEFITTHIPYGLGAEINTVKKLCIDDNEVLSLIDELTKKEKGGNNNPDGRNQYNLLNDNNVNIGQIRSSPTGNTKQAGIRRLRKDRPDLHEKVIGNQMTVHEAMISAGFRKKTLSINIDEPLKAARSMLRNCDVDYLQLLIIELKKQLP